MGIAQDLLEEARRKHESGMLDLAAPLYERVLRLDPGHAGALYHLGKLELARANPTAGAELLRQAAANQPQAVEVHQGLGVACKRLGQWANAAQAFERALEIDPDHAPTYFELADLSQTLGHFDAAINFYLRTINLDHANTEAFRRLGELLYARANWVGAENCFARVVDTRALDDDRRALAELLSKLGISLIRQEKLAQAAAVFRRILEIDPAMGEMHSNLAYVYERQGRLDDALAAGLKAVALKPGYAEGHNNLGVAYRALHRLDDARHCFARAVAISPDFALAQFNLGAIDLMQGNYAAGWPGYDWRDRLLAGPIRNFTSPRWDGRPIPGQRLLVHAEQGYGDTIQFARFLALARERSGAQLIFECPPALGPLLQHVAGADFVICDGQAPPPVDAQIALASLPAALGVALGDLAPAAAYLAPPEARRAAWRERLAQRPASETLPDLRGPLAVGFVWAGNPAQQQDLVRSCPPAHFARLAAIPGVDWYCLQKEVDDKALCSAWPGDGGATALGPMLTDFAETAAAICALDLVISVDTATAHLAGALGRPTWTLLPHTPDWRWQLARIDSAWYSTMRLFRQPRWGDWDAVFANVATALREQIVARRAG